MGICVLNRQFNLTFEAAIFRIFIEMAVIQIVSPSYCIVQLFLQVKYVIWSKNLEYAALLSKHTLTLVTRKLEVNNVDTLKLVTVS